MISINNQHSLWLQKKIGPSKKGENLDPPYWEVQVTLNSELFWFICQILLRCFSYFSPFLRHFRGLIILFFSNEK